MPRREAPRARRESRSRQPDDARRVVQPEQQQGNRPRDERSPRRPPTDTLQTGHTPPSESGNYGLLSPGNTGRRTSSTDHQHVPGDELYSSPVAAYTEQETISSMTSSAQLMQMPDVVTTIPHGMLQAPTSSLLADAVEVKANQQPPAKSSMAVQYQIPFRTVGAIPSTVHAARSVATSLTQDMEGFVQIPRNAFRQYITYILNNPGILSGDLKSVQAEALEAYKRSDNDRGDQIVDRLAILHYCQKAKLSFKDSCRYIHRLSENQHKNKEYTIYKDTYEKLRSHLKATAPTYNSTAANVATVPPQSRNQRMSPQPRMPMSQSITPMSYQPTVIEAGEMTPETDTGTLEPEPEMQKSYRDTMSHVPYAGGNAFRPTMNISTHSQPRVPQTSTSPYQMSLTINPKDATVDKEEDIKTLHSIESKSHADFKPTNTLEKAGQFEPRHNDAKNFFGRGRVFRMWFHAPAGKHTKRTESANVSIGPEGTKIYSKLLWMVVIQNRQGYSICCPISTYDGRGVSKPGLKLSERRAHAIIYSEGKEPTSLLGESDLTKYAIKVKSVREYLHAASRIHFGQAHTVHWDTAIMDMGRVVAEQRDWLSQYYAAEHGVPATT